ASAGLQRLSWKSISILRPSAPPLALASSRASSAPQRACWPKVETPPVSGVEAPMTMGPAGAWAKALEASATSAAAAVITRILSMFVLSFRWEENSDPASACSIGRGRRWEAGRWTEPHVAPTAQHFQCQSGLRPVGTAQRFQPGGNACVRYLHLRHL